MVNVNYLSVDLSVCQYLVFLVLEAYRNNMSTNKNTSVLTDGYDNVHIIRQNDAGDDVAVMS